MKTNFKKCLVVVMMLGTLMNYANEKKNTTYVVDGKKVKVEFNTVKKGNTLTIKDSHDVVIYSQDIEKSGNYAKIFDLSKLVKGEYTAELEKDFEIIVKNFSILEGKVSFKEEKTIFKPVIRTENNLVLISKIDFNKEPLKVALYYNGDVIFSETIKDNSQVLNRIYKLSEEEKGNYSVVINSNKRSYVQDFNF
ncbi:hypothetical protein [Polaribacter sp.]|uniref:hypothetical protein n=1 Tax=Polaribacter sp. TaxID=1920175 RepID=UPI003F6C296F